MGFLGTLIVCLCLYFLLILIKFFNKVWLTPIRIRSMMESQGIKGPSYRLLYGSIKEIINIRNEIMGADPMELSDPAFPIAVPHIYSWIKLYGKNFIFWRGPQARLVITEPELIKDVLNDKDGAYPKADIPEFVKKLLGDGLVTTRGAKWVKLRKVAHHAFHSQSLKSMIPAMIASVEMMLERWRQLEVKEIEVFQEFKVLSSEIISRTAFGSSYLQGENIFDMLMKLIFIVARNETKIKIPGIGRFVKTRDDIESNKLEKGIRESIMKMIKKREEETSMGTLDSYGSDFLGLLLKAYHDEDNKTQRITIDDLIDECKTFYIAGHETTSSALTWTILLLAIHTEWQDKARKEALQLFGQQNPNPDGIGRLNIMSMVVNESLRLYSPVVDTSRKAKREVRLGKLIIPANIEFQISFLAVHADPIIWGEDVHLFKPERFAEGVAKAATAFLPFGLGPRSCVGMNFAITETKIALSMILQRYKFTLSPNYVHSPFRLITMCPQYGLPVMFQAL